MYGEVDGKYQLDYGCICGKGGLIVSQFGKGQECGVDGKVVGQWWCC